MYVNSSLYDVQIARYFGLFPRGRFLFVSLAEIEAEQDRVRRKIAEFLDLDLPIGAAYHRRNVAAAGEQFSEGAAEILARSFSGLADRVENLIGHQLNWRV